MSEDTCPACGRPLAIPTDREGRLEEILRDLLNPLTRSIALERARRLARDEGWNVQGEVRGT